MSFRAIIDKSSYYSIRYANPESVKFDVTNIQYGVSPFVRYYIGSARLKPYVGVAYSYSKTHSKTMIPSALYKSRKGLRRPWCLFLASRILLVALWHLMPD